MVFPFTLRARSGRLARIIAVAALLCLTGVQALEASHAHGLGDAPAECLLCKTSAPLPLASALPAGADQASILAACAEPLARLKSEGYASLEVLSLDCGIDGAPEQRTSLRQARRYPVDQQFYCLGGRLQLCLQVDDYVLAVQCEKHDLLRVPAGVGHWLDIGEQPRLALVRLFASSQVPAAALADQTLAGLIPGLDD